MLASRWRRTWRRMGGTAAGLWAAAALATVAYAPSLAAYSFVDFAALAFFLAALRRLGRLADDKGPAPHHLLRLALLCGMAAATSSPSPFSLLLLLCGRSLALRRSARRSF
ncbi:hypothetical protein HS125_18825 [bacterium]|nr:hypothetical protein [bacterium]